MQHVSRLFDALEHLERDLHEHVHKENNILFPKAIRLERLLAGRQGRDGPYAERGRGGGRGRGRPAQGGQVARACGAAGVPASSAMGVALKASSTSPIA